MARAARSQPARDPEPIDFEGKTCEETTGAVGDTYIRCGAPALMLVKHRGRDEGPYFMCHACGEHNASNRNAYVIARMPDPDPISIVRFYPDPTSIIRAYVESEFALRLATEHERKVRLVANESVEVTDAASFQRVGELLMEVVRHRKDVEAWFKPIKDIFFRAHRMICDRESHVLQPLMMFERAGKDQWDRFRREEERKRREEEQRLAEQARLEEQRRLEAEAALYEQRGEPEVAEQVLEQALHTPAPAMTVASNLPAMRGISARPNWKWRPIGGDTPQNRARAEKMVPREFMELSDRRLTAHAKAHGASARVPGIEFYDAGTVSVR